MTGEDDISKALASFSALGTGSIIITSGADEIHFCSNGGLFSPVEASTLPISEQVSKELRNGEQENGDTTGCGDNFAGGVLASVAEQTTKKKEGLDLEEACSWGVVSGGFACFYIGGMFHEDTPGEKRKAVLSYFDTYVEQISQEKENR